MKNKPPTTRRNFFASRAFLISLGAVIILTGITIWLATTMGSALVNGDGTDKYQGVQRDVAKGFLASLKRDSDSSLLKVPNYFYVEAVYPTTDEEKIIYCDSRQVQEAEQKSGYLIADPTTAYHYTVRVTSRSLLGYEKKTHYYDGCTDLWNAVSGYRQSTSN